MVTITTTLCDHCDYHELVTGQSESPRTLALTLTVLVVASCSWPDSAIGAKSTQTPAIPSGHTNADVHGYVCIRERDSGRLIQWSRRYTARTAQSAQVSTDCFCGHAYTYRRTRALVPLDSADLTAGVPTCRSCVDGRGVGDFSLVMRPQALLSHPHPLLHCSTRLDTWP